MSLLLEIHCIMTPYLMPSRHYCTCLGTYMCNHVIKYTCTCTHMVHVHTVHSYSTTLLCAHFCDHSLMVLVLLIVVPVIVIVVSVIVLIIHVHH